ncbi:MAG: hypothetical protein JOS17DRAFT_738346 [Linnemannia elongata]|nr:MAG: hypothetical protein JOS17DRAFT_738346 [Linnemannia elongata]
MYKQKLTTSSPSRSAPFFHFSPSPVVLFSLFFIFYFLISLAGGRVCTTLFFVLCLFALLVTLTNDL